ncbi:P-loop containing nucleoside triphosphate hydrolase protein [Nemania abortiva]|nr:P-loop containing nucleoside triphosphate hydrolase protein [Nemania abortiva]
MEAADKELTVRSLGFKDEPESQPSFDFADYPVNFSPMTHLSAIFHGREEVMKQLDEALEGPSDKLRSVLIHGLGGVGKTQTALNYARINADKYDAIFWIRSETTLSINHSIRNIARGLKLPGSMREDGNDEQNLMAFQSWLRTQAARKSGRKWLMIFDNVENIEDIGSKYVPTTGGSAIITSRYPDTALPTSSEILLKPFSKEDSIKVLRDLMTNATSQIRSHEDDSALKVLANKVDGLPLGLRVIAGLMNVNSRKNMTVSKFLNIYEEGANELMKNSDRIVEYEGDSTRRVGAEHVLNKIWHMSFTQLENKDERKDEARVLLGILSLLGPDGLPQSLFGPDMAAANSDSELHLICDEDGLGLHAAIATLSQMALANLDGPTITIHRLIQDAYVQYLLDGERKALEDAFSSAITVLQQRFPHQVNGRPMHGEWEKCRELVEHTKWLADHYSQLRSILTSFPVKQDLAELLKHCAWYLFEMADHRTALHMLEIAQDACAEKRSELYAHLLNTIGCCSFELNDLQRCRQSWEEALDIRQFWEKQNVPGAKEELANQFNNFGNLESAEGMYESALDLFEKARKIRVKLGTDAIVPLAVTYMTTGRAYFLKGMYLEAWNNYQKAEEIFMEILGRESHFMAHEFLEKALTISELREAIGDTARVLRKKADILSSGTEDDKQQSNLLLVRVEHMLIDQMGIVFNSEHESEDEWDSWVCPYWR